MSQAACDRARPPQPSEMLARYPAPEIHQSDGSAGARRRSEASRRNGGRPEAALCCAGGYTVMSIEGAEIEPSRAAGYLAGPLARQDCRRKNKSARGARAVPSPAEHEKDDAAAGPINHSKLR